MFIMTLDEIKSEIRKINNYISKCSWMDFVLFQSNLGVIELYGAIDQTYNNYIDNYEIKIEFEQPHYVSSMLTWSIDTSKPFIELASLDEQCEMNVRFRVKQGNYMFKINVEDFENSPIFIIAKRLNCKILNDNPFPKE